ncbi:hypothetical protein DFQ28_008626 [Apophysomyces sp. BC1034]|nr:hypothetical protein DFQ30_008353 [Apophysomyces sp. BC1015]KAG0174812.1 hypothetical protein DFQ29_007354 [Apophysomyces sp. BC1021]KAG0185888.1 hypothetical protein DFQ28_008626 [Apophysomyces sp. BC1034]
MKAHGAVTVTLEPSNNQRLPPTSEESQTPSTERCISRLEIDNAYLSEQNAHLQNELSFARYTIHALKTITSQKDMALQVTRQELERACFRIRMLSMALEQREDDGPTLIADTESSSDDLLSDEELGGPSGNIMTKLPLRCSSPMNGRTCTVIGASL